MMKNGLIFAGGGISVRQVVELACEAEQAGLDSVYVTEAWRSAFVMLAAIATATRRVEIGPYILNAYGRSPWLTAMSAVDLDELSGGRLVLGVGTGNKDINEDWQGIAQSRPLRKMDEYVTVLRKAVRAVPGETVDWQGEIHRMKWSPAVKPLRPSIPVLLAALYPKMIEVAGRVADGIAMGALLSPGYVRDTVMPAFTAAARKAGRDPARLGATVAPFVSVDDDPEVARQAAREAVCRLYSPLPHPYYDFVLREQGFARAADAALKHVPEGRIEKAMEAFTDDVLDAVTISGSLDHCRRRLQQFDGLVDQVLFVNVNYSGTSQQALISAFRNLIRLGSRNTGVCAAP